MGNATAQLETAGRQNGIVSHLVVLSLFPGIGFLDAAFEELEIPIVRGPDPLWGGDIHRFNIPAGRFNGIIGGPPCQIFSALKRLNPLAGEKHGNLIPQFERVVAQGEPDWFLMENVPGAPTPIVPGFIVKNLVLNNRWFGADQERTRRFSFGTRDGRTLLPEIPVFESPRYEQAVTSSARAVPVKIGGSGKVKRTYTENGKRHGPSHGARMPVRRMLELQGFDPGLLDEAPFTESWKRKIVGNGVPLTMGRAVARAVVEAMYG